jgi:dCMP deaminase
MRWVEYFRNLAHQVKLKSKDENTQIGAIIVGKDKEIVSTGYNSFPRGLKDYEKERQERPEKYYWFEHAERNAIYNAARIGVSTKGCTMYLSCGVPCSDCARGIINSGIIRIFCERGDVTKGKHWEENYDRSWTMLEEAGIDIQFYDDDFYG